jgi:D-lactate dehydrogenase (cytochrome)
MFDCFSVELLTSRITNKNNCLGTGEHGVGIGKRSYLVKELGPGTVRLMKTIKATLDPHNLFNPGKVCVFWCMFENGLLISVAALS